MHVRPLRDRVVLRVDRDPTEFRGIFLAEGVERPDLLWAVILAAGPAVKDVRVGDRVGIPKECAYAEWRERDAGEAGNEVIIAAERQLDLLEESYATSD